MPWSGTGTSLLFYQRLPFVWSGADLLPQLDLTVVDAELL